MKQFVVDVTSESRHPVNRDRVRGVVVRVLQEFGVGAPTEVSVRVVGDRKMKFLNETYRKKTGTTDVLSFPTESFDKHSLAADFRSVQVWQRLGQGFVYPKDEPFPLGDIIISFPQARLQAAQRNVLVDEEIDALVEHGVKSLLGHHPDNE